MSEETELPVDETAAHVEPDPRIAGARRLLTEQLNDARWRYHVLDAPTISDGEFDTMMRELNAIEDRFPGLRTPDSPTQQVGGPPLSTTFTPVEHRLRLLSLDNVFARDELERWAARAVRELGPGADRAVRLPVRAQGRRVGPGSGVRAGALRERGDSRRRSRR